jgi:hypothetical protein
MCRLIGGRLLCRFGAIALRAQVAITFINACLENLRDFGSESAVPYPKVLLANQMQEALLYRGMLAIKC